MDLWIRSQDKTITVKSMKEEKNNLIKYIEEKISHLDGLINDKKVKPYGEELHLYESAKSIYQDLLERIKNNNYE